MAATGNAGKGQRQLLRNLAAGLAGVAAAAGFVIVTLRLQDFSSLAFVKISLFVFPVPVACGLAVGMVSPRKAIVWAPLWAAIFALLFFALLTGTVREMGAAFSSARVLLTGAGVVLAALAGLVGQIAAHRGLALKTIAVFLILCCIMGGAEYAAVARGMHAFEREKLPAILMQINSDYMEIPQGLDWHCQPQPTDRYRLQANIDGSPITVVVLADMPGMLGISYELKGSGKKLKSGNDALAYLQSRGFRQPLLGSLSLQKGVPGSWCASLGGTRLILNSSGDIILSRLPEFE